MDAESTETAIFFANRQERKGRQDGEANAKNCSFLGGQGTRWRVVAASAMLLCAAVARAEERLPPPAAPSLPTPPEQPEKGFGGREYPHASYQVAAIGEGNEMVWVFEPADPAPAKPAPVVIFLHGWGALDPIPYGGWIRHLVRRGNLVIYPKYQEGLLTPPPEFTAGVLGAVRAALKRQETEPGRVRPDRARLAAAGHSFGGTLAMQYAALAERKLLPAPRALLIMEPGMNEHRTPGLEFELADHAKIPAETLLLMIVGDRDIIAGDRLARRLWSRIPQIPDANKDFLTFRSDDHGRPELSADHLFPLAVDANILRPKRLRVEGRGAWRDADALDTRGVWRLLDALMSAAFTGQGREQCLGDTAEQKDLGKWTDGTPVKAPKVETKDELAPKKERR